MYPVVCILSAPDPPDHTTRPEMNTLADDAFDLVMDHLTAREVCALSAASRGARAVGSAHLWRRDAAACAHLVEVHSRRPCLSAFSRSVRLRVARRAVPGAYDAARFRARVRKILGFLAYYESLAEKVGAADTGAVTQCMNCAAFFA